MSVTASRNGGAKASPTPDVEAVLGRLREHTDEIRDAVVALEDERMRVATRHSKEREALQLQYREEQNALSEQHRSEVAKLQANLKLLRQTLRGLGVEPPPPAKIGPGGRPRAATALTRGGTAKYKGSRANVTTQRSVIEQMLALTETQREVTVPEIVRARSDVADNNMSSTYATMELLRERELIRKGRARKLPSGHKVDQWAVWDREQLIAYMEALDATS